MRLRAPRSHIAWQQTAPMVTYNRVAADAVSTPCKQHRRPSVRPARTSDRLQTIYMGGIPSGCIAMLCPRRTAEGNDSNLGMQNEKADTEGKQSTSYIALRGTLREMLVASGDSGESNPLDVRRRPTRRWHSLIFVSYVPRRSGSPFQPQGWPSHITCAAHIAASAVSEITLAPRRVSPVLLHTTPQPAVLSL